MIERIPTLPPPELDRVTLLHGRLDEQRARQDSLSRGLDELHERLLAQAVALQTLGDKVAWLEPALRDARSTIRFLNETCKTLADRIADLESRRDEP